MQVCSDSYEPKRTTPPVASKGPTFTMGSLAVDGAMLGKPTTQVNFAEAKQAAVFAEQQISRATTQDQVNRLLTNAAESLEAALRTTSARHERQSLTDRLANLREAASKRRRYLSETRESHSLASDTRGPHSQHSDGDAATAIKTFLRSSRLELRRQSSESSVDSILETARREVHSSLQAGDASKRSAQSVQGILRDLERRAEEQKAEIRERSIRNRLPIAVASDLRIANIHVLQPDERVDPTALAPQTAYAYDSYVYVTDRQGLPAYMHGLARHVPEPARHEAEQRKVVTGAAAPSAENELVGGHAAAVSLGGHPSGPGLFPQDKNMNVSSFAKHEGLFRKLTKEGRRVEYSIRFAVDTEGDYTPSALLLAYSIDSQERADIILLNEPHQLK